MPAEAVLKRSILFGDILNCLCLLPLNIAIGKMPDKPHIAVHMKQIVKQFPGITANDHIDFRLLKGEIHSLLGENGAGKTTLMNILSGFYQPDEGDIYVNGNRVCFRYPGEALSLGIGMIHQHFRLVSQFTVAENIILGASNSVILNQSGINTKVRKLSNAYGLDIEPEVPLWKLSVGEQQRVEILKMLFRKIQILIMDEPTAVLTPGEVENLFKTIRLLRDTGCSVVFITHKLEEVVEVSDYITVLRRGKVMSTVHPTKIQKRSGIVKSELARMMVGREVILEIGKGPSKSGKPILKVENLAVKGDRGETALKAISFVLHEREILGILGVAGNGQTELVEALTGLRKAENGTIEVNLDQGLSEKTPMCYVPEDRLGKGTIPSMSISYNLVLTCIDKFSRGPLLMKKAILRWAEKVIEKFKITPPNPDLLSSQLSGGNLQKVILARELSQNPAILIAEQPTRGLDIGATEDVWKALINQRNQRSGVLLVSGDLREVLTLSDRVLVLFRGEIMDIISMEEEDRIGDIGPLMAGVRA